MGSGSLTPSGLFEKAHSICMGEMSLPKPATSGLSATQINNTLRGYVSKLKSSSCQSSEDSLKNYYIKGEVNECESGYSYDSDKGTCVDGSGNEIEVSESKESSFMSAKKSCEAFENALISSRDNMYAKFQDNMTNYLDEHLAKLMKKQAKSNTTIAQAFQTLKKTDAENQKADIENETEIASLKAEETKLKAKATITQKEAELEVAKATADAELKKRELDVSTKKQKNLMACKEKTVTLVYGRGGRDVVLNVGVGKYACEDSTFGDPRIGKGKQCWYNGRHYLDQHDGYMVVKCNESTGELYVVTQRYK